MTAARLAVPEDPIRQPDTEIYLKDAEHAAVAVQPEQALGPCGPWWEHGQILKCTAHGEYGTVRVTQLPKVVGKWHNLFLENDSTPRDGDFACARAAHAMLGVEIRCAPGGWEENQGEEDVDRWLRVDAGGIEEITWRTA